MCFCGKFKRKIDSKWRIIIPPCFRKKMGERFYYYDAEDMVRIYPSVDGFGRNKHPFLFEGKMNSEGRTLIPKEIRSSRSFCLEDIGIVGCINYVEIVGCIDYLEIWPHS